MLISEWIDDWKLYEHADTEHEATIVGVHSTSVGTTDMIVLQIQREDGKCMILRMRKHDAKSLALHIQNLYPSVVGDH